MRRFLIGGIVLAALIAPAASSAADLPGYSAPAETYYTPTPVFNWNGLYAGVNAGYGFGGFTGGGATPFGKPEAGILGFTGGYNFQINQFVVGVEGDVDWANLRSRKTFSPGPVSEIAETNSMWSLRARAGYAVDNILLYVTGGYVGGQIKTSLNDPSVPPPAGGPFYKSNNFNSGYVIGAGLEYALTRSFSVKAEYLYRSLGQEGVFGGAHLTTAGLDESIVRGGVNYHF